MVVSLNLSLETEGQGRSSFRYKYGNAAQFSILRTPITINDAPDGVNALLKIVENAIKTMIRS